MEYYPTSPELLISVIDLLIQRKDFLQIEPFYSNLPFVRSYVDREDKLKVLGYNNFYNGYIEYISNYIKTLSDAVDISELISSSIGFYAVFRKINYILEEDLIFYTNGVVKTYIYYNDLIKILLNVSSYIDDTLEAELLKFGNILKEILIILPDKKTVKMGPDVIGMLESSLPKNTYRFLIENLKSEYKPKKLVF